MDADDADRIDVRGDGRVILYKRPGLKNPKWQARIRVPNAAGYKIVTTKTANDREAERFALDLYESLYMHVKAGGSVQSKTFKQVFEEWKKHVTTMGTSRGGSWDATIDRVEIYAVKFFGAYRIEQIGASEFSQFWAWRKSNFSKKQPSNGTLRRERTSLMPVFKYALMRGYISKLPETAPPKATSDRRPTFTLDEWRTIIKAGRAWVREGKKKSTWRDRFVSQQVFFILANTGMRVGELRGLRWGDLRTVKTDKAAHLVAYVRGKTGKREVVFQGGADIYVKRLFDLRKEELGQDPVPSNFVVCHKDGTAIGTMMRSFQSLLSHAGIPAEKDGGTRTVYSLRHFYATQRLSHDTSPFLLAKQMGTSVEMLEKFYGQTVTSTLAAQITKSSQTVSSNDSNQYPFS
ncbi:tyrosine-type recombinase/integrase [Brevundimonas sp. DC300-4]|uniref:tyrosine-type recombinase/integrase n=1 Tax=Brevundimonas sp. DC300-4 TaxID=2804594 RepID=UPI003CED7690